MTAQATVPASATAAPAQPKPARSCGGCTLCCKAVAAPTIGKPAGTWCQHTGKTGCTIFAQRWEDPSFVECRGFRCLWLQGWFGEQDRPDKIRGVFFAEPDANVPGQILMQVSESYPESAMTGRARELIDGLLQAGNIVVVRNAAYITRIVPGGEARRFQLDPHDAMRVKVNPTAAPIQLNIRVGRRG